jgi:predicted amidohydrolase
MRIGLVQLAVLDGDVATNVARAEGFIRRVVSSGDRPDVVLLPELWTSGYAFDRWPHIADHETPATLAHLAHLSQTLGVAIGGSMVTRREDGALVNRFTLTSPNGTVTAEYDKSHLFSPMREPEFLTPGASRVHTMLGTHAAAMSICYDLRFPGMYRASAHAGVSVYLVVSAWPHPRSLALRTLATARAIENQAFLVLCNRVGPAADGTQFCGGSMVVAPTGDVVLDVGDGEGIGVVDINPRESAAARAMLGVLREEIPGVDTV